MKPIHILLVEDNEGDILLTREAFESGRIINRLSVVKVGKAAIDFLTRQDKYANETLQDLLLLDINLPKKTVMRYCSSLKQIPI